jgi:hypothetical protein
MLLARLYESAPLACPPCGADRRIIAFVTESVSVRRILEPIGEPAQPLLQSRKKVLHISGA